jgi:hypothetical protein
MLENRDEKPRRGVIRRGLGRIVNVMLMPVRSFPGREVADGGRLIGRLMDSVKRGRRRADGRFRFHEDGGFDLAASAFLHGISVHELERRLEEKRRQTARIAYVCFALGWVSFGAWIWRAATMPWTVGHVLPALEFAPFCLIFFLAAFQSALRNYQIRRRRAADCWEYLKAEDFWPG